MLLSASPALIRSQMQCSICHVGNTNKDQQSERHISYQFIIACHSITDVSIMTIFSSLASPLLAMHFPTLWRSKSLLRITDIAGYPSAHGTACAWDMPSCSPPLLLLWYFSLCTSLVDVLVFFMGTACFRFVSLNHSHYHTHSCTFRNCLSEWARCDDLPYAVTMRPDRISLHVTHTPSLYIMLLVWVIRAWTQQLVGHIVWGLGTFRCFGTEHLKILQFFIHFKLRQNS